jgi:uncharacterized damage-inducible protein DinB
MPVNPTSPMDQSRIIIDVALKAWNHQISRAEKFFDSKSDEDLLKEIAPGRNRVTYLIGHLVASNESMLTLFGLASRQYPSYDEIFLKSPDKSALEHPSVADLRKAFKETHQVLNSHFEKMSVNDWLSKHTAMTDEDLAKEPTRNKLSVLMNRTGHVSYHMGQIVLTR